MFKWSFGDSWACYYSTKNSTGKEDSTTENLCSSWRSDKGICGAGAFTFIFTLSCVMSLTNFWAGFSNSTNWKQYQEGVISASSVLPGTRGVQGRGWAFPQPSSPFGSFWDMFVNCSRVLTDTPDDPSQATAAPCRTRIDIAPFKINSFSMGWNKWP